QDDAGDERSLLSERGSVAVDQRTNTLIVQDTRARLNGIRALVRKLDIPVQQVLIEARAVVASTDVSDEFGVRWGGLGVDGHGLRDNGRSFGISGRLQSLRDLHDANFGRDAASADGGLNWTAVQGKGDDNASDLIVDMGVDAADATRF